MHYHSYFSNYKKNQGRGVSSRLSYSSKIKRRRIVRLFLLAFSIIKKIKMVLNRSDRKNTFNQSAVHWKSNRLPRLYQPYSFSPSSPSPPSFTKKGDFYARKDISSLKKNKIQLSTVLLYPLLKNIFRKVNMIITVLFQKKEKNREQYQNQSVERKDSFQDKYDSINLSKNTWDPKVLRYYIYFFTLLAFIPLFYFDKNNSSIFFNWIQDQGLPKSQVQSKTELSGIQQSSDPTKKNLPKVVLLKDNPRLENKYPLFQANQVGLDFIKSWQGGIDGNDMVEMVFDPEIVDEEGQPIINYESTNETISEENILDWVDENEKNIFESEYNPFTLDKEDISKKVFEYHRYRVIAGDSLWSISKKFNISIDSIISLNQITAVHELSLNTELLIPQVSGIYYQIKKRDSLLKIAKNFGVKVEQIKDYNQLGGYLQVGKTLFLPGGKYSRFQKDYLFGNLFSNPVEGSLTSRYGFRKHPIRGKRLFHTGIDIAKNSGDRVRAVANGVVVQARPNGGYGKYVSIQHDMGYETAYAHLGAIWVRPGQKIKKGQYLGRVGNSGISTGPHLHFEVKHRGKFINPLRFVKY